MGQVVIGKPGHPESSPQCSDLPGEAPQGRMMLGAGDGGGRGAGKRRRATGKSTHQRLTLSALKDDSLKSH